jgi:hypothetical protein
MGTIYDNLGRGVRSVADYDNEAINTKQNALALMLNQQKADEYSRGVQEQNALRGWTPTGNDDADYASMRRISPTAADAYRKSQLDAGKTKAETANKVQDTSSKALADKIKATEFHAQRVSGINSPEQVRQWVDEGVRTGVFDAAGSEVGYQMFMDRVAKVGLDAAKAEALQLGMNATQQLAAKHAEAVARETNRSNVARETETSANNIRTDTRVKSEGAANRGVTMRGQNMTDARANATATAS